MLATNEPLGEQFPRFHDYDFRFCSKKLSFPSPSGIPSDVSSEVEVGRPCHSETQDMAS
jgi:hypothetical protein